jgi:hypothetical protein
MDEQAQMQAIVDKLTGSVPPDTLPLPSAFDQPWRSIYLDVRRCGDFEDAEWMLARVTRHIEQRERYSLVKALCDMLPSDEGFTAYPSLHEISGQFADVDWLWPSWIPRGMLTLFGAAPGAGKSLVALDLARRVIHGEPFPDGTPPGDTAPPGSRVLIVDAEGAPALLNQRAQAWEIDSSRLFLMLAPDGGLIDLAHPAQQELFCEMCRSLNPALVVVDSLAAATARGETSLEAARAILGFLSNVAREGDHALLLIHHLRKRARVGRGATAVRVAADDLRGSSHISAAARSVMALSVVGNLPQAAGPVGGVPGTMPPLGVDPDEADPAPALAVPHFDGPRRLEIVKTNLCRHPPPLGLIFEGENVVVPTLRYTEYVEPAPEPTQTDLCAGWLFHFLDAAGEPVKPADAVRAAREAGYSRRTVYRARNILGGLVVDLGTGIRDPHKRWTLPAAPSPPPACPSLESPANKINR